MKAVYNYSIKIQRRNFVRPALLYGLIVDNSGGYI
jgi:hypothetical protein